MVSDPKTLSLLTAHLKSHGYSLTKPRRVIFEHLLIADAQSMKQLSTALTSVLDRATIYRTIKLFEELGIVQRLTIGWKYKLELSDVFHGHHHHVSCVSCNSLLPIAENGPIEKLIAEISSEHNFHPIRHQLEIEGYCQDCFHKLRPQLQTIQHAHHLHEK
jgi:Fur family ferric uptake transcriptional regulator